MTEDTITRHMFKQAQAARRADALTSSVAFSVAVKMLRNTNTTTTKNKTN